MVERVNVEVKRGRVDGRGGKYRGEDEVENWCWEVKDIEY